MALPCRQSHQVDAALSTEGCPQRCGRYFKALPLARHRPLAQQRAAGRATFIVRIDHGQQLM